MRVVRLQIFTGLQIVGSFSDYVKFNWVKNLNWVLIWIDPCRLARSPDKNRSAFKLSGAGYVWDLPTCAADTPFYSRERNPSAEWPRWRRGMLTGCGYGGIIVSVPSDA